MSLQSHRKKMVAGLRSQRRDDVKLVEEYIEEGDYDGGIEYWSLFDSVEDVVRDFDTFKKILEETEGGAMKTIVSLSGGMDSATILGRQIACGHEIIAVAMRYPSKHNTLEIESAEKLADHYRIPFRTVNLIPLFNEFKSDLLVSGGPIPEGHYTDKSMSRTVVPGRNMIFISTLAGLAWSLDASSVYLGIHAGDHAIYPDCRPDFFYAMRDAVEKGTDGKVSLAAPYLTSTKAQILKEGLELKVPYHLTRTCYTEGQVACGRCGSCVERIEAFMLNNAQDPLPYLS